MHRTQIYLDDEIHSYLEMEKKHTGLSCSEIIRSSIKRNIEHEHTAILHRMENAAGTWDDDGKDPAAYLEDARRDRTP